MMGTVQGECMFTEQTWLALVVQLAVGGLYPNNTASVLGSFTVCNSTVYLIDAVLLPAASLAAIPQLNSSTTAAAPAPGGAFAAAPAARCGQ